MADTPVVLTDAQRELLLLYLQKSAQLRLELDEAMSTNMMSDASYAAFCRTQWVQEYAVLPLQQRIATAAAPCSRQQQFARMRTFLFSWFMLSTMFGIAGLVGYLLFGRT